MVLTTAAGGTLNRTSLWVVPVSDLGGVARHVLDVARVGLPGWRLVVLCPEGPLADRLRELGSAVIVAPFGPSTGFAKSVATLRTNVLRLRPDVVHSHLAYADVVAAAAVLGLETRLVTTEHGIAGNDAVYHGSEWKARLKASMHHIRLRRADAVIAVSNATRDTMSIKWRPEQPIAVIPNGVDSADVRKKVDALRAARVLRKAKVPAVRILSLSRLAPEKRLDILLQAFALVREYEPAARLTIAGDGPELEPLERLAGKLGLSGSVDFVGFVDPLVAMAEADILVQLSVWENCSYTLLDAVSAGLEVVATAVGGNPEILPPHCLVSEGDAAEVAYAIRTQPMHTVSRPGSIEDRLDVRAMATRISDIYSGAMK